MINKKGLAKELSLDLQKKITDLEETITLKCPYAIKEEGCFYWCGTPFEKDIYPNGDPNQVKDEGIKIMMHIPFESLKHYCFWNFWDCIDHPGY